MKVVLIDYQTRNFYYCDEETRYLQNVKKAIQFQQNKLENRDINRKYRKKFLMQLLTMATYLKNNSVDAAYLSMPQDEDLFEETVKTADFVYLWAKTAAYPRVSEIIKQVKKNYGVTTILGGYHAMGLPKEVLEELPELDYVCIGESERTLLRLVRGEELSSIHGIAYRENGEIIVHSQPEQVEPSELLEPDYSILHGDKRNYRYAIQTTRSCPYRCKYCLYGYYGGTVRHRSMDSLKRELLQIKEICGPKLDMHILDNIIGYNMAHLQSFAELVHSLGMDIGFSGDIRAEFLTDPKQVDVLKDLGVRQLFFGFEDAEEKCRINAGRFMDENTLMKALQNLKKHSDIKANCYWMMGMPGTTPESFDKNISVAVRLIEERMVESICTDTIFVPRPGSPMFDHAEDFGIRIVDKDWSHYQRSNYMPVYELESISRQEIRDGLVKFDRAVIKAQLDVLEMEEETVYTEYEKWAEENGVII